MNRAPGSTRWRGRTFSSSSSGWPVPVTRRTLVLVTHHVEEIVPIFTHVLMLSRGKVLAAGPQGKVLTTANLTATFGAPVTLRRAQGRYRLDVGRHVGSFAR